MGDSVYSTWNSGPSIQTEPRKPPIVALRGDDTSDVLLHVTYAAVTGDDTGGSELTEYEVKRGDDAS